MADLEPDRQGYIHADGQKIYWEYFGRGDREAVCLLNGLAMHTRAWYGFLPLLLPHADVLLYDYPGQGQSSSEDLPCLIPRLCDYLTEIVDTLGIERFHALGISYGGFVALDYARLYQRRLHTLSVSGILLSHERLFQMYQELSLLFYQGSPEVFEVYTYYMYEKIFGEAFVVKMQDSLDPMRERFHERYRAQRHALIRLTEAQNPFFGCLDANLEGYRAIRTPTLIMAGEHDRAIPPWVQKKITGILPSTRFELVPACGHVVYLERPDVFFGNLVRFMAAKQLDFDGDVSSQ
jgi:pimeloyl-ACP methyl ester carboxylesterase